MHPCLQYFIYIKKFIAKLVFKSNLTIYLTTILYDSVPKLIGHWYFLTGNNVGLSNVDNHGTGGRGGGGCQDDTYILSKNICVY